MKGLFSSHDSKFFIKTSLLLTLVPLIMFCLVVYSVWLIISLNFSYFLANGIPLGSHDKDVFIDYLLQTQVEYLPFVGGFFVLVFFIGLFLSHIVLRPFTELKLMCKVLIESKNEKIKIVGLEKNKLLIKLGNFICQYYHAKKNKEEITLPQELKVIEKPVMDYIFYFQFLCLMGILMTIAVVSLYVFAEQLHSSIIQTAIDVLKAPKGMSTFIATQKSVFDTIVFIPSLIGITLYILISRMIISRVEGVTYGFVRDITEVTKGNFMKRLSPRKNDPGLEAAVAVNNVLDALHPRVLLEEDASVAADELVGAKVPV